MSWHINGLHILVSCSISSKLQPKSGWYFPISNFRTFSHVVFHLKISAPPSQELYIPKSRQPRRHTPRIRDWIPGHATLEFTICEVSRFAWDLGYQGYHGRSSNALQFLFGHRCWLYRHHIRKNCKYASHY